MTRDDLTKIAALSDNDLAKLTCVDLLVHEANIQLANAMDAKIEKIRSDHAAEVRDVHAKYLDDRKALADARKMIDTLGGTELGQKIMREQEIADLKRRREEIDERLSKI